MSAKPPHLGNMSTLGRDAPAEASIPRISTIAGNKKPEEAPAPTRIPPEEKQWKTTLYHKLLRVMDLSLIGNLQPRDARRQIKEILHGLMESESVPLNAVARQRVIKRIEDEILGLGPLEPLLEDRTVSEILVNGYDSVYVERRGRLELTDTHFDDNKHLMNIIDRIVSNVGRRIDESSPMVDARLADGSRVNVIIPPLAVDAPIMSIRRFAVDLLGMEDLVRMQALTPPAAEVLQAIVKGELNIVISGGTGSGKTTMLNVLSGFIPGHERIVTIEDSAELQLQQRHVVRLETRPPNVEGKGEVTQRDLVRNSLRMRPDRIVVGEVRSAEALDMLQAMNTGHDGSLTTIHANTPRDALGRVENMVAMTGLPLPIHVVRSQMAAAFDVILQISRMEDGSRKLISVQEVDGMEGEIITMTEIFSFKRRGLDENGKVLGELKSTGILPRFYDRLAQRGIHIDREIFSPDSDDAWRDGSRRNLR